MGINIVQLPGIGIDYWDLEDQTQKFSAVEEWTHPMLTLRERWMLAFMNQITDKPNWTQNVFDDDIIAKWEKEAITTCWNKERVGYRYVCEYDDVDEYRWEKKPIDNFTDVMFEYVSQPFLQSEMGYRLI